ncbi:GNAT family N-acetyltransferase [Oceanibacterium hippocampi]|uniref:Acetyltransferase (GNAT) family protein n=1 Tax=Oceanibacterium hippocampi TaxID=745714 RepID=A0A1Y5U077_9PROT|nr:GNAT family N-acetyltransferase [Oceanibacterium hippocampi]SLN75795.1 Acetyltransferase (GNAT) family protein [Oceanibacterium hippocampi]
MSISKLEPRNRDEIRDHLLRLDLADRRLRFFGAVGDGFIRSFCNRIDWGRTVMIGYRSGNVLRGLAQLSMAGGTEPATAEFAASVEKPFQNRGIGTDLLRKSIALARNRFIRDLHMACLPENLGMQRMAQKCGASLAFRDQEMAGRIRSPWPSPLTLLEEAEIEAAAFYPGDQDNSLGTIGTADTRAA